MRNKRVIGITGGIGAGKSVVCRIVSVLGLPVYDCDRRAKGIMLNSDEVRKALIETLGEEITDSENRLNNRIIAQKIFNDSKLLQQVNAVVHKAVINDFVEWSERQTAEVLFVESAILVDCDLFRCVDEIWYVEAPVEVRVERVIQRSSMTESEVMRRIALQKSIDEIQNLKAGLEQSGEFFPHLSVIVNDNRTALLPQILDLLSANHNRQ